jgi:hypothetical protein
MEKSTREPHFVLKSLSLPGKVMGKHGFSNIKNTVRRLAPAPKPKTWLAEPHEETIPDGRNSFHPLLETFENGQARDKPRFHSVRSSVKRFAPRPYRTNLPLQHSPDITEDDSIGGHIPRNSREQFKIKSMGNSLKRLKSISQRISLPIAFATKGSEDGEIPTQIAPRGSGDEGCLGYEHKTFVTTVLPSISGSHNTSNMAPRRTQSTREHGGFRKQVFANIGRANSLHVRIPFSRSSRDSTRRPQIGTRPTNSRRKSNESYTHETSLFTRCMSTQEDQPITEQRQSQDSSVQSLNDSGYGSNDVYISPRSTWKSLPSWVHGEDVVADVDSMPAVDRQVTCGVDHDTMFGYSSAASSVYSNDDALSIQSAGRTSPYYTIANPKPLSMDKTCTHTSVYETMGIGDQSYYDEKCALRSRSPQSSRTELQISIPLPNSQDSVRTIEHDTNPNIDIFIESHSTSAEDHESEWETESVVDKKAEAAQSTLSEEIERHGDFQLASKFYREALRVCDPNPQPQQDLKSRATFRSTSSPTWHQWKRGAHKDPVLVAKFSPLEQQSSLYHRIIEQNRVCSSATGGQDIVDMKIEDYERRMHLVRQAINDSNRPSE